MNADLVRSLRAKLSILQDEPLSGGIVAKNMHISDNGSGELTLYGDFTITLKVLDLTTDGAPNLNSLMIFTQQVITSKLRGGGYKSGVIIHKYNPVRRAFDRSKPWTYSIRYNFNIMVSVIQVNILSQIRGNDFVLAVVDSIGHQFTDQYGRRHSSGGITKGEAGPATVSYSSWLKNKNFGAHEFFHTLGLSDLEDSDKKNRLMYHLGDNTGQMISDTEKGNILNFIVKYLGDVTQGNHSNINLNTVSQLKSFLNNPTYGFKFNKAKFR